MHAFIESDLLPSLLKASWQAAVLIMLVLAAQWAFGQRLSPRWRCALWLIVVVRLALPWTIPSTLSVFNLLNFSGNSTALLNVPDSAAAQPTAPAQTASALQPSSAGDVVLPGPDVNVPWLLVIWSAGAAALAIVLLTTHFRLSRKVSRERPLIDTAVLNLFEDCKQVMEVRVPVTLVETSEVGSPALFGFVRPRLLLPIGLTRTFSGQELRYVFLHELGHIKRHDIPIGWLATALQILHWFNPLVWLAFHRLRVDRELACDALVLAKLRPEENQPYGQTIIRLLERFGRSAWGPSLAGTVENMNQAKERIRMIAKFNRTRRGLALGITLSAVLGLTTLTDAQPASAHRSNDLVGTWVLVGAPDHVGAAPAAGGRLKSITDTHWTVSQTDPADGKVLFHHGGSYTLKGNEYVENIEFAGANTKDLVGKTSRFNVRIEGDLLTLIGIENPWKEVWRRADASKPQKSAPDILQGSWTGEEGGASGQGACSLVIRGSNFEFRTANTNEWMRGTLAVYNTQPKQLVAVITAASIPQFVGQSALAIFELQNGTFTVAGNAPGNPVAPASLDARGTRRFVFKKQ